MVIIFVMTLPLNSINHIDRTKKFMNCDQFIVSEIVMIISRKFYLTKQGAHKSKL